MFCGKFSDFSHEKGDILTRSYFHKISKVSLLPCNKKLWRHVIYCMPCKIWRKHVKKPSQKIKRPTGLTGHLSIRDFLSEVLIFVYQQPNQRINENQQINRQAASLSLHTIVIIVQLFIDRVGDNTYSL